MTETIGNWTIYDLILFLVLWQIIQIVAPLVVRDVFGPAFMVLARWLRGIK